MPFINLDGIIFKKVKKLFGSSSPSLLSIPMPLSSLLNAGHFPSQFFSSPFRFFSLVDVLEYPMTKSFPTLDSSLQFHDLPRAKATLSLPSTPSSQSCFTRFRNSLSLHHQVVIPLNISLSFVRDLYIL